MSKPDIIKQIEDQLGLSLRRLESDGPAELMKYRNQNTFTLDATGKEVTGLNLRSNGLNEAQLPFLPKLKHLAALNLSENQIAGLHFTGGTTGLKYLDLSENASLRELTFAKGWPELEVLDLNESGLPSLELPAGFTGLRRLDLRKNGLKEIRFGGVCPALFLLDLSENELAGLILPAGFSALQYLYLNDNRLKKLKFRAAPRNLETLHLRNNQLEDLPENFHALTGLTALYLYGNPLPDIPKAVLPEGERDNAVDQVRDYLREFRKGTKVNDRVKLIIVGNGRVGKTSLFRRLKGENFDEQEPYTHGIHLGQLHKDHLPEVKTGALHVNVWDFGGQEIFYATHQFFLSEDALYVLAWTDKKHVEAHRERERETLPYDERWQPREYWLEGIRLHGRNSPVIMVQTHIDKGKEYINEQKYREEPYMAECLDFSAARDYGLPMLKDRIAARLNADIPFFGAEFPETYDNVIREMERLRSEKPVIFLEEFREICRTAGISAGGEDSVLDYLRKTGIVVYFGGQEKPLLREVVYIDPNWLTQEVYRLINRKLRERKGRIDQGYLKSILPEYSAEDRVRFVELLKSFELIFEMKEKAGGYVAPQYLPDQLEEGEQRLYNIIFRGLTPGFFFRFPLFVPDNVMINFLSRYGPFSENIYWKNGICFSSKENVQCIVTYEMEKQMLAVYSEEAEQSGLLQNELCRAFVELSKNANAEISLDGERFVSWQKLERAFREEINKISTVDDRETVSVSSFARFFDHGELGRAKLKSPAKKIFFSYSRHDREFLEQLQRHLAPLRRQKKIVPWDDHSLLPGEEWDEKIKQELAEADIILLLISAEALDTDYIWDVEIKSAMERHRRGEACVIPVILKKCDWKKTEFQKLNALPLKGKPVNRYKYREDAWQEIVTGIEKVL